MLSKFFVLCVLSCTALNVNSVRAAAAVSSASTFAGSTTSAVFPPPNITVAAENTLFPDASQVGFAGATPTGDEAEAIATAPSAAKVDSFFPLLQPATFNKPASSNFNVLTHLGNLSPFQSVKSFGLPNATPQIPNGCELTQVHLLHRHGARYPTGGAAPAQFAAAIHATATGAGFSASGPLAFLNTWTYKLGAEILTPFGREQLFNLGVGFRVKYGDLLKGFTDLPVFRTTSEGRMVDSALNFAAGFFGVQTFQSDYHQLITIESDGFNNTLAPFSICNNSNNAIGNFGSPQSSIWANIYLKPTIKRLQPFIKGFTLNVTDLVAMQQLCAYETVALGFSSFCDLFTEDEWKGYEYFNDLSFWYSNGPGNPTSGAQGKGYVAELIARLTQTRITDFHSAVNSTIVNSNVTFPLSQPIFVDASHDTVITAILTAMNFTSLSANGPLPTDHIPAHQTYFVSQQAPFGSNLVGQVLACSATSTQPTHIRWILNDGVLPLTGIKGCKADKNGLCELPAFISAMQQITSEIDFDFDCFANYTIPIPDTIIDGRFPASLRN